MRSFFTAVAAFLVAGIASARVGPPLNIGDFFDCVSDGHVHVALDPVNDHDCTVGGGTADPHICICNGGTYSVDFKNDLGDHVADENLQMGDHDIAFAAEGVRVLHIGSTGGNMVVESLTVDPPFVPNVADGRACRPTADLSSGCLSNWCSLNCKCAEGGGDCDASSECQSGLFCRPNVGLFHGCSALYDICSKEAYWCASSCSTINPCQAGRGDCSASDANCRLGLECRVDAGVDWGCTTSTSDICESEADTVCDVNCDGCLTAGQGNCTDGLGHNKCGAGLICVLDIGAYYGCNPTINICE